MHILDTDTLTHLHAGHPRVVQCLRELTDPLVATTIITKIELLRGRFDYMLRAATGPELLRAQHCSFTPCHFGHAQCASLSPGDGA